MKKLLATLALTLMGTTATAGVVIPDRADPLDAFVPNSTTLEWLGCFHESWKHGDYLRIIDSKPHCQKLGVYRGLTVRYSNPVACDKFKGCAEVDIIGVDNKGSYAYITRSTLSTVSLDYRHAIAPQTITFDCSKKEQWWKLNNNRFSSTQLQRDICNKAYPAKEPDTKETVINVLDIVGCNLMKDPAKKELCIEAARRRAEARRWN